MGDVKALFDPIDFVIFDGMNGGEKVRGIVFMDPSLKRLAHVGQLHPQPRPAPRRFWTRS